MAIQSITNIDGGLIGKTLGERGNIELRLGGWEIWGSGGAPLEISFIVRGIDGDVDPSSGGHTCREIGGRDPLALGEIESGNVELFLVEQSKTVQC